MSVRIALALFGTALLSLALAVPVSAATVVVPGNASYEVEVGPFLGGGPIVQGSELSFSWSSDRPLSLVVSGPSGIVGSYSSSTHGSDSIDIGETGDYFMTWTNTGSTDASLTYDYDVDPFAPVEDIFDPVIFGVIIAAVVIAVVIVLVIFFVILQDKEKKPAVEIQPSFAGIPRGVSGNCPKCGSAVDGVALFCARCGAKIR